MSRRARKFLLAREAKHADAFAGPVDDDTDDEGGIDVEPTCGSCGAALEHAGDDCPWCGEAN